MGDIVIRVVGQPAPQGSKQRFPNGGLKEMSPHLKSWREAVRSETQRVMAEYPGADGCFLTGPVLAELTFWLTRPKAHYGTGRNAGVLKDSAPARPTGKPDVDKLARSTLDGLKFGGAYADDAQVVSLIATKWYAPWGVSPGASITIRMEG